MRLDSLKGRSLRAVAYCRFGVLDTGQTTSYELATVSYRNLANAFGWRLVGFYVDHGCDHSSRDLLLETCRGGGIDLIVTRSISRFEGNPRNLLPLVDAFHEARVPIYFEDVDICTRDDYHALQVYACIAEQEVEQRAGRGFACTAADARRYRTMINVERS